MDDLISRQALLAEYDRLHVGEPGRARKMIEDAPSVQPDVTDINVGDNGIMWQYCNDPNAINKAIDKHDENWEGLTSVEQIISITYDTNHGCYVVFWRCKQWMI